MIHDPGHAKSMPRPSVLFMEIDGVLVSRRSSMALGALDPNLINEGYCPALDPVAVTLLRLIVDITRCVVVVGDMHARAERDALVWSLQTHYDWPSAPIVDSTPCLNSTYLGYAVEAWLDANKGKVGRYAILSSRNESLSGQPLVLCPYDSGLGAPEVMHACHALGVSGDKVVSRRKKLMAIHRHTPIERPNEHHQSEVG